MPIALRLAARRFARKAKAVLYLLLGALAMLVLKILRLTNPAWAAEKAGRLMRGLGPWLPEHRTGRANLQAAFPDWPPAEIERVLGGVWDNLGRIGAEFVHLDHMWQVTDANTGAIDGWFSQALGLVPRPYSRRFPAPSRSPSMLSPMAGPPAGK